MRRELTKTLKSVLEPLVPVMSWVSTPRHWG